MSDENPVCLFGERGQYDRERRPHIVSLTGYLESLEDSLFERGIRIV